MKAKVTEKKLQSQLSQLKAEAEALRIQVSNTQRELNTKEKNIKALEESIARLGVKDKIKVSEHALLRYMERVKGIDIAAIEAEVVTDEVQRLVNTLGGTGTYPAGSHSVVMKNNTVVTVTVP